MIVHLLPAGEGDCVLLKSSDGDGATTVLIDGGRKASYADWKGPLQQALKPSTSIDLVVVTHIDADHISGILAMLHDPDRIRFEDIWFNAYPQIRAAKEALRGVEPFGVKEGDKLSKLVCEQKIQLNRLFGGERVVADPSATLMQLGDIGLICVSPDDTRLAAMEAPWAVWLAKEGMLEDMPDLPSPPPGLERFGSDRPDVEALWELPEIVDDAVPNGTSIAFLAHSGGKTVLMAADAHPTQLEESIGRLLERKKLKVDLFKISHHGSKYNTSKKLLNLIDCSNFAFSSNGRHDLPNPQTVARVLKSTPKRKVLYFNYRQPLTECWDDDNLKANYNYDVVFSGSVLGHIRIDL